MGACVKTYMMARILTMCLPQVPVLDQCTRARAPAPVCTKTATYLPSTNQTKDFRATVSYEDLAVTVHRRQAGSSTYKADLL